MRRETKQMLPLRLPKYPTVQEFEKFVNEKLTRKIIEGQVGPDRPIIPNYLTEMHQSDNPFTTIKYQTTKGLQSLENRRKEFNKRKRLNFSVTENVSRTIRNKFTAKFMLKEFQYKLDKTEYQEELKRKESSEISELKTFEHVKRKPNYNFILDKRKICLLDLTKQIKFDQIMKLDKIVETEEKIVKINMKTLVNDQIQNENLLKSVCSQTSNALKILDKATVSKNKISEKLKRANFLREQMNSECTKLEDEYLRLKSYQTFLFSCYTKKNKKISCASTVSEIKISTLLNEMEKEIEFSVNESRLSFDTNLEDDILSFNNFNNDININNDDDIYNKNHFDKCIENMKTNKFLSLNKEQLKKLNEMITAGYSSNTSNRSSNLTKLILISEPTNFTDTDNESNETESLEDCFYFSDPIELVNVISELENNNLNLIENVQEQEEICDNMINRLLKIKNDMDSRVKSINNLMLRENDNIDQLENSISFMRRIGKNLMKLNDIDRYRSMFYLEDLCINTVDELLDYMIKQICDLYSTIFEEDDPDKTVIERLCRIELYIDSLYINIRSFNFNVVMKAKKAVDERKREINRFKQKQLFQQSQLKKLHDAIEKAKIGPSYHFGRKIVYRSQPIDLKEKFHSIKIQQIRKNEEYQLFFE